MLKAGTIKRNFVAEHTLAKNKNKNVIAKIKAEKGINSQKR